MIPPHLHIALSFAAALLVSACSTTSEPELATEVPQEGTIEGSLSSDQITAVLSGNTGYGQEKTYQWRTFFETDGGLLGRRWTASSEERDSGTWEAVKPNQLCRQWATKWDGRKRACFEAYKDGELIKLINIDGNADSYEMMLVSGNKVEG